MNSGHYKFPLLPLPYGYNELEPYIDEETMHYHHDKHLKAYVDNLNEILKGCPNLQKAPLKVLIKRDLHLDPKIETAIKNNAGGVYNHNFYFYIMTPKSTKEPIGSLKNAIEREFGSFAGFKEKFIACALKRFGSGYAWLTSDNCGKLKIISTANQDTPLTIGLHPIILVDVWEHAYYLKYKNNRKDYLENWFNVVDWEVAENNYSGIKQYRHLG